MNLVHEAQTTPELLIAGFGLEEGQAVQEVAEVAKPQGGTVNLNLGAAEETQSTPAKPVTTASDTEDILAMADDIFNS